MPKAGTGCACALMEDGLLWYCLGLRIILFENAHIIEVEENYRSHGQ